MNNYKIITDSTIDLPVDVVNKLDIDVMPMDFTLDGTAYSHYIDERQMSNKDFYEHVRNASTVTTAQVQYMVFEKAFEQYLSQGTDVIYIAFSSGLSGTYQTSLIAKSTLQEKYPDRKIIVVDSLSACAGEGLLVHLAAIKRDEGASIEELEEWINNTKLKLCHWFTVDDLMHLKRGGRISIATALVGSALGVKPVMHVDDEGHLIPVSKVRGRRKSLEAIANKFFETAIEPEKQIIYICHGDCVEDAELLASMIKEKCPIENIDIACIGPIIGAHSGPGTLALFFIGSQR